MTDQAHTSVSLDTAKFQIHCTQLLSSDGVFNKQHIDKDFSRDTVVELYHFMKLNRLFDEKAVALQRTGRLGTFASSLGQEAVSVGVASAMHSADVFLPSFREQGGQLLRGVTPQELLSYWGGDERGNRYSSALADFPVCIPVASQYPHAVGVALAFKIHKLAQVAVVVGGDGSTSKGDFYEAMNMAGAWNAPVVFVIDNNQWAISTPRRQQSHARTLAQKAIAAGIPGEQVDGNDALAVRYVTSQAIERARAGEGPSLIEAISYRMADHTTADDARRYRDEEDVSRHWKLDPLARLKTYLVSGFGWSLDEEKVLQDQCTILLEQAEKDYLAQIKAPASDMFDWLFASLPPQLEAQREELIKRQAKRINQGNANEPGDGESS